MAILFRQTNVIWCAFIAGWHFLSAVERRLKPAPSSASSSSSAAAETLYARQYAHRVLQALPQLLTTYAPYLLLAVAFAAFLVWNGGIVVGDRTAHTAGLHTAQLLYLVAFVAGLDAPALLDASGALLARLRRRRPRALLLFAALTALAYVSVTRWAAPHAYLLADNRHYTFYLWKNVLARYNRWLVPAYATAALLLWSFLRTFAFG